MQNFSCVFMKIWDGIDFPGLSKVFYPIRDATICRIYISNEDARNLIIFSKKKNRNKNKKQDIKHVGLPLK
jgi:hypothetical protein